MSSKAYIEDEDLLIEESHEKKLLSALNRISKAMNEIESLGYEMYVSADSFNVMNVDGAGGYKNQLDYTADMVVASFHHSGIDMGDW